MKTFLMLTCAVGALGALPQAAEAQTALGIESAPSARNPGANVIDELVVTAERRAVSVQDLSVAVTAITSEARDRIGIVNVSDVARFTPGMSYSFSNDRTSIRGISRFSNNQAAQSGVAVYSDGIYFAGTFDLLKPSIFTERMEVLRGPQGTLYGRNSTGGALNVISRRPTDDFYAEVRANVGNYGFREFSGAVSGPISDSLRFRLAAVQTSQDKGYFKNAQQSSNTGLATEGNRRDEYYVEGQLEFDIGDNFEGWAKIGFREWDNNNGGAGQRTGPALYAFNTNAGAGTGSGNTSTSGVVPNFIFGYAGVNPACPTKTIVNNVQVCSGGDFRSFDANTPGFLDLDNAPIATLALTYHASGFDVKYVGGYSRYKFGIDTDVDGTSAVGSYIYPGTQVACTGFGAPVAGCTGVGSLSSGVAVSRVGYARYQEDREWHSNELNFISTGEGPFNWLVGLYEYADNNSYTPVDARSPNQPELASPLASYDLCTSQASGGLGIRSPVLGAVIPIAACATAPVGSVVNTVAGAPNPLRRYFYNHFDGGTQSRAVFAQASYAINDNFTVTGGIRYSQDKLKVTEVFRATCFGTALCSGSASPFGSFAYDISTNPLILDRTNVDESVVPGSFGLGSDGYYRRQLKNDWTAVTGVAKVEWRPDEDTLVYLSYSRGYKAGGFNAGAVVADPTADPEHVDAYELGVKHNWGRTLYVNTSLFNYAYTDAQAPLRVPTAAGLRNDFTNIPEIRSRGFEAEAIWSPAAALQILANYAWLDARIRESGCYADPVDPLAVQPGANPGSCAPLGTSRPQDLKGQRMPASPKHRVTLNATYNFDLSPGVLSLSATWAYRGAAYGDIFNRVYTRAPSYTQTDLRASFTDTDDRYTVIGYVRNAFDQRGYENASSPGLSAEGISRTFVLTPPRTYGVELQYRF